MEIYTTIQNANYTIPLQTTSWRCRWVCNRFEWFWINIAHLFIYDMFGNIVISAMWKGVRVAWSGGLVNVARLLCSVCTPFGPKNNIWMTYSCVITCYLLHLTTQNQFQIFVISLARSRVSLLFSSNVLTWQGFVLITLQNKLIIYMVSMY